MLPSSSLPPSFLFSRPRPRAVFRAFVGAIVASSLALLAPHQRARAQEPASATAVKPRVVVIAPATVPAPFTPDILVSEMVDEMRTSGVVEPVSPALLTPAQKSCQDEACLAALAAATKAAYVVRFEAVAKADDDYMFQATAWRASTRTAAGHASAECGLCLGEKIRLFARNVAGQIEMAIANDEVPLKPLLSPLASPAVVSGSTPTSGGLLATSGGNVPEQRWRKALPWATAGLGVALATTGIVLWAKDGDDSCDDSPCRRVYDTRGLGAALLGAGIITAGIGAVLFYELRGSNVTVAIGPGSLGAAGRF